jgi:hypothetical protein
VTTVTRPAITGIVFVATPRQRPSAPQQRAIIAASMRLASHDRRIALILAALVIVTHGYFYNGTGWNQGARLGSIFAFVEPGPYHGTFRIEGFLDNRERGIATGDWARHEGRHYSNKAPGTTFLGIPAYFALYHAERALGFDPTSARATLVNGYLLSLACGALWTAIASVVLYRFCATTLGWRPLDALIASLVYALATLVFPFDSSLWGHTTAAAFALIGYVFLMNATRGPHALVLAGFFCGMAFLTEYLSGISLAAATAYVLVSRRHRGRALYFLAGAALPVLALLIYQKALFGSFLTTATSLQNPGFLGARRGGPLFGPPSPAIVAALLVSLHRGVFVYMPVLLFAMVGAIRLARAREWDRLVVPAANVLAFLIAVSCFQAGWHGGDSAGPRYMIASIPFWCLLLPPASALSPLRRAAFLAAAVFSFANMLVVNATTTMVPSDVPNPLYGELWPALMRGRLGSGAQVFTLGGAAFGYEGLTALAPLAVLLAAGLFVLMRMTRGR